MQILIAVFASRVRPLTFLQFARGCRRKGA